MSHWCPNLAAHGVRKLLGTNQLTTTRIRPSNVNIRKSRTTNEAHQANHAPFPFFPIGHVRVGSRGPTYKVKT